MDTDITAGHTDIKSATILLLRQGCTDLERLVYCAMNFCAVALNISSRIIAVFVLTLKNVVHFTRVRRNTKRQVAVTLTVHSSILGPEYELAACHRLAPRIWKWLPDFFKNLYTLLVRVCVVKLWTTV